MIHCSDAKAELAIAEAEQEIQGLTFERQTRPPDPTDLQTASDRLALAETELRIAEEARVRLESAFGDNGIVSRQDCHTSGHGFALGNFHRKASLKSTAEPSLCRRSNENAAREKIHAANVSRARYQLSLCEISSPIDGTVTAVNASAGEMAIAFEPIIYVADGTGATHGSR